VYSAEFITCFLNYAIFVKFYLKPHVQPERLSSLGTTDLDGYSLGSTDLDG